jgi:hypothetical protein
MVLPLALALTTSSPSIGTAKMATIHTSILVFPSFCVAGRRLLMITDDGRGGGGGAELITTKNKAAMSFFVFKQTASQIHFVE